MFVGFGAGVEVMAGTAVLSRKSEKMCYVRGELLLCDSDCISEWSDLHIF